MKNSFRIFLAFLLMLPVLSFSQDEDLINSIDIEGINLMGYPKWDFSLVGGFGYRFEPIPDETTTEQREHLESMKSSYVFGASAYYFYKEGTGVGLAYSSYRNSGGMKYDNPAIEPFHVESEKVLTDYIGPSIYFRQSNNDESFYFGPVLGIGYMRYQQQIYAKDNFFNPDDPTKDDFLNRYNDVTYSGGALAVQIGLNTQKKISEQLAFGVRMNLFMGVNSTRSYWQIRKRNNAQRESLSRIELALSLHYLKY